MIYAFDHEDAIIKDFMKGTESEYSTWDKVQQTSVDNPIVLRGMTKGKYIHQCWKTKRDFYYIDTGYVGNLTKRKHYHRLVRNNVQHTQVRDVPDDRYRRFSQRHPTSLQEAPIRICLSQLGHGTGDDSGRASRCLFWKRDSIMA